jgi:hypothetical protein
LRFGDSFADNGSRFKFSEGAWRNLNNVAERLTTVAVAFQATVQNDKTPSSRSDD